MLRSATALARRASALRTLCTSAPLLPPAASSRLTLCLDIEESLVHVECGDKETTAFRENNGPEVAREHAAARAHDKKLVLPAPDAELVLPYLDSPAMVYKRPLLDEFLEETAKLCDLVLFTSAAEGYAKALAEVVDPEGKAIALLTREHCSQANGVYVKDLSRLGRPLERVVLLDDNPGSFFLQVNNGLPVEGFFGDPHDRQLSKTLPLIRRLADADDVRDTLRAEFGVQEHMLRQIREAREALKS